jgi:superfamily II DNA or RNA helicase
MPTGSGKTFTAVSFAVEQVFRKRRDPCVVWISHNDFLLEQARAAFLRALGDSELLDDVEVDQIRGDGRGADANLIFGMVQTLARSDAIEKLGRAGKIDLVVFDEFHRLGADTWRNVPARFGAAGVRTLGLSATPFRSSYAGTRVLRKLMPHRVFAVGYTELVRSGFLADPVLRRVVVPNVSPLTLEPDELRHLKRFRQLKMSALDRIATQSGRDELIVDTYLVDARRYGSTIVFCTSVAHAERLASRFRAAGVPAASICGSAAANDNREKLQRFARGNLTVVTGVALLTEGVDVPVCRSVFLARPTESPVLLTQMIGRAMRGPAAGGASSCNIVDFVDTLANGVDVSASHFAFFRDSDERLRPLVSKPAAPGARGVSVALLLRLREFLQYQSICGSIDPVSVLRNEVRGWLEHWDGHVQRVLLVPEEDGDEILEAVATVRAKLRRNGVAEAPGAADEVARTVFYESAFSCRVSEEDFVAIAASGAQNDGGDFHTLRGTGGIAADPKSQRSVVQALATAEQELFTAGINDDLHDVIRALRQSLSG